MMAHQRHLEKAKFRQWVKAGLGLDYLREGLLPFCDEIVNRHHTAILDDIKQKVNLSTVTCGHCTVKTLKPDHVNAGYKQCPFGQVNCNCCFPSAKTSCPNNVCGAIYDAITKSHGSTPPAPNWKNSNTEKWCTDPWSIAKCFISAPGYDQKITAADIDCTGILHIIINNQYFHNHIMQSIDGSDLFSKVRQHRNKIFHSSTMELEENDANRYIDEMIAVLQDGKELNNRQDTKNAVKKLQDLKKDNFIVTTKNEADVCKAGIESLNAKIAVLSETLENAATTEAVQDLETRVKTLEEYMAEVREELKDLKTDRASKQDLYAYIKRKLEYQTELICYYKKYMLQVSAMPFEPEDKHCNFNDVYVQQCMTSETTDNRRRSKEVKISSMSDIFKKDGNSVKSIFVLGDAGSGKTFLCKSLINYWCLAHSGDQEIKDEFDGIEEMKNFEFVFYISLRHCKVEVTIKEMLKKQYDNEFVETLLHKESASILIVLDGLDEWTSTSALSNQCLPFDPFKDYTVLFTSRLWHIRYRNKIKQKIVLTGFDNTSVNNMIDKTVPILNDIFHKEEKSENCKNELDEYSFKDIRHIPIMLQQLICLWFDGKLYETSKCVIYTRMLDLVFVWHDKHFPTDPLFKTVKEISESSRAMEELPDIFTELSTEMCMSYTYLIQIMSELAYETTFNKKPSLTFDPSTFEQLKMSDKARDCCLKLGILTKEIRPSLSASECHKLSFSFVHTSVHEFLAAMYIAIKFNSTKRGKAITSEICRQFLKDVFKCRTVDDIFEQANILIMLCGFEPKIASSLSKYVYDICSSDGLFLEYRENIENQSTHYKRVSDIQQFIQNSMKEVEVRKKDIKPMFYLGDIVVDENTVGGYVSANLDKEYMFSDTVLSFRINIQSNAQYLGKIFKYIPKCRQLEAVCIHLSDYYPDDNDDINYDIYEIFDVNASKLKAVSLSFKFENKYDAISRTIIRRLPDTEQLIALNMEGVNLTHTNCDVLCTFISGTSRLEQISLKIMCECKKQHELDVSQHKKLKYLNFDNQVLVKSANASNLERFKFSDLNRSNFMTIFGILKRSNNLRELEMGLASGPLESESITSDLVTLLQSLRQLFQLKLRNFAFVSSIFNSSSEMVNLEHIYLYDVRISEVAWRVFVDTLCNITHPVNVNAWCLCITHDEKGCSSSEVDRKYTAGLQYVREKGECFNVAEESNESFIFSRNVCH
ncbi:uncharacterized protein LOC123541325 [Mercenaria mercenaria]|uniref:uncharacterized protein LOC123541325 n=1 Tax=Mercenaria mercenaria TaxID=6596 RepID=UPI00234F3274|nr:uncharacterized protein LOC123541325 [Mercenaria mercenaria]XP_053383172.1 uncharacterized protein LOC123541325 [Mercenaria mercenaria]